jgi:hypothetical protein
MTLLHHSYGLDGKRRLQDFPKRIGARIDDQGRYRFAALREGDYYVRIDGSPAAKQPMTYYPGTTDEVRAVPIRVVPGREVDAGTMVIPPQATRQVRFTFPEATNPPLMRQIAFPPDVVVFAASSRAGGQGQILLSDVAVGEHEVLISWDSAEGLLYSQLKLNVQNTSVDQSIVMKPASKVTGTVSLDMNGRKSPVIGARCLLRPDFTRIPYRMDACLGTTLFPGSYSLELEGVPSDVGAHLETHIFERAPVCALELQT